MMLKDIDYRSYLAGLLTGSIFLVMGISMMAILSRDLGGLRRRQPQTLGCQSERRVALGLLEGIAGQLEMSADDVWNALNAGKTFPELFAEKNAQQEGEGLLETGTVEESEGGEAADTEGVTATDPGAATGEADSPPPPAGS